MQGAEIHFFNLWSEEYDDFFAEFILFHQCFDQTPYVNMDAWYFFLEVFGKKLFKKNSNISIN